MQVYPPTEVVQEGCDRVRKWCSRRMHDRVMARRHTIVMAVQDILRQVTTCISVYYYVHCNGFVEYCGEIMALSEL